MYNPTSHGGHLTLSLTMIVQVKVMDTGMRYWSTIMSSA